MWASGLLSHEAGAQYQEELESGRHMPASVLEMVPEGWAGWDPPAPWPGGAWGGPPRGMEGGGGRSDGGVAVGTGGGGPSCCRCGGGGLGSTGPAALK